MCNSNSGSPVEVPAVISISPTASIKTSLNSVGLVAFVPCPFGSDEILVSLIFHTSETHYWELLKF